MKVNHLIKPFTIDASIKLDPKQIEFSALYTNKEQHKGEFYHVKYAAPLLNEVMHSYYGAKVSYNHATFGGNLSLMSEFLTSIILYTIANLRSGDEQLLVVPRVLIGVEDWADDRGFRLFSQMLESFEPFDSVGSINNVLKEVAYGESMIYSAGLFAALQEADNNIANYGTGSDPSNDYKKLAAKIDSNSDYNPKARSGKHGGVFFNHLKRRSIQEVAGFEDRNVATFSAMIAEQCVFSTIKDHDMIRFAGEGNKCLSIKDGCDENFKYFMMGVQDFVAMPDNFMNFLVKKTLQDLSVKHSDIAEMERENITSFSKKILTLKQVIAKYFEQELLLFRDKFPETYCKSKELWGELLRRIEPVIDIKSPKKSSPSKSPKPQEAEGAFFQPDRKTKTVIFAEV